MEAEAQESQDNGEFAGLPAAATENDEAQENNAAEASNPAPRESNHRTTYQPYVDLSGLPEDIRVPVEARFAHMSRLMKKNDLKLNEWQELAAEQSRKIEELTNGFSTVATHLQDKTFADTEATLKQQARAAFEAGDNDKYFEIQDKLTDLRVEKKLAGQKEAPPKKEARQPAPELQEVEVSPQVQSWQEETDDTGAAVRPWAQPTHPGYRQAYAELLAIKTNPRMEHYSENQIMQELDRRMGTAKAASRQQVMGGNLTRGAKPGKLALNPKQEEIAVRMKLGGPKASRDQHIEAYRKQLSEIKGTRQ